MTRILSVAIGLCAVFPAFAVEEVNLIELRDAVVVCPRAATAQERMAAQLLVEEVEKRTGVRWSIVQDKPSDSVPMVVVGEVEPVLSLLLRQVASQVPWLFNTQNGTALKREGFLLLADSTRSAPAVYVAGHDARGVLFGCGRLLRELTMTRGSVQIPSNFQVFTSPAYPIRGHQLGFRAAANSWDAWTVAQFDQYIRELTFFGVNSIENIPFQDDRQSPLMKVPRREMNRAMSEICAKYGLDYWVWTPADFDLKDAAARAAALDRHEQLYKDCKELTGVFFPGGDPGDNPPELVMPFLADVAKRLLPIHPEARIWLSLQGFNKEQAQFVRRYLETEAPAWLAGIVAGPSSPPIPEIRNWLPKQYRLRDYPDITHNKICQYPVPWWDQALALTLGREAINPRPVQYAYIHNWFAPYTDGFISYSDGVHDDVNKAIWSARSWDPSTPVRDVLIQYARVFFAPQVAEAAADGILALEKNWRGPLADNGGVDGTLLEWRRLETAAPDLKPNWRWQMCLLRANYDAYIRRRLLHESKLEDEANAILAQGSAAEDAMSAAMAVLNRAVEEPIATDLRTRIVELSEELFQSIGLQSSVEKYSASGAERGAFLDFIDYPMNNRWWLEDEFKSIRAMTSEEEKSARLMTIATWEHPGFGSYYDDLGNAAKSPHVLRSEEVFTEPGEEAHPEPTLWWWDNGLSRARLSWQTSLDWPLGVVYEGLDPGAAYTVRLTGYHQSLLRIDGERVSPTLDGQEMGEFKEFPVDAKFFADRKLVLTWDSPADEGHLNWRQRSRLAEIWLLKR